MPDPNRHRDVPPGNPAGEDALAQAAAAGRATVPGDHEAALARLRDRLAERVGGATEPQAPPRTQPRLRPRATWRRPLAIAAAASLTALVVALSLYLGRGTDGERPVAVVLTEGATDREEALEADLSAAPTPEAKASQAAPVREDRAREAVRDARVTSVESEDRTAPPSSTAERRARSEQSAAAADFAEPAVEAMASSTPPPAVQADVAFEGVEEAQPATAEPAPVTPTADIANAEEILPETSPDRQTKARRSPPAAAPASPADAARSTEAYTLERAEAVALREVSGAVLQASAPVADARLTVEETGQAVAADADGRFAVMLPPEAVVAVVTAPGYDTLRFDLTDGDDFEVWLPRTPGELGRVQRIGREGGLRVVAPWAARYPAFDAYAAGDDPATRQTVVVQFDVTRDGRPRNVRPGPGPHDREAFRAARRVLLEGPTWPERYRRSAWRYRVPVGE